MSRCLMLGQPEENLMPSCQRAGRHYSNLIFTRLRDMSKRPNSEEMKNKINKILYSTITIAVSAFILSGCVKDGKGDCYDGNLILRFAYESDRGEDLFDGNIDRVDVLVFDENRHFIFQKPVEKNDLRQFRGTRFELEPGQYYIICWANLYGNSNITGIQTRSIDNGYLIFNHEGGGDPVHFAPLKNGFGNRNNADIAEYGIRVPEVGVKDKTYHFMRLYRTINIYVKGMTDVVNGINLMPRARVTNLPSGYDFGLNHTNDIYDFVNEPVLYTSPEGSKMSLIKLNTSLFEIDGNIDIDVIRSSNGEVMCTINLEEYLEEYPQDNYEINVQVTYKNGDISISLPEWEIEEIEPASTGIK